MARIRTLKPEFWGNHKTARVSRDARLLFLGLLNESDDEGRQLGSPKRIAGAVFPNDDDVTPKLITKWLDELERTEMVRRYMVDGVAYLLLVGFEKHQKVDKRSPSRLPAPPTELAPEIRGEPAEKSGEIRGEPADPSGLYLGVISSSPSGGDADASPPNDSAFALVSGYIADYRKTHNGHDPSQTWRGQAGKAATRCLADGEDVDVLAACLGAIARESKAPNVLSHVVADYHAQETG